MNRCAALIGLGLMLLGCGSDGSSGSGADADGSRVDMDANLAVDAGVDRAGSDTDLDGTDSAMMDARDGAAEAGSDGPPPALDPANLVTPATSGTRLKARWIGQENGAKVFRGWWYDSMLAVNCSFSPLSDGKQRCMPDGIYSTLPYSDDHCTKPVFAWPKDSCPPASYVYNSSPNVCPYAYTVYQRKGKTTEILSYTKTSTGACKPGVLFGNNRDVYALEEVPPSTFVAAEVKPGTAAGGLAALVAEGADGSRSFAGWQDTMTGEGCTFRSASDQTARCLPTNVLRSVPDLYSDSACKNVAAYGSANSTCSLPAYAVKEMPTTACTTRTLVNKLGAKVKEAYYKVNGGCVVYPASDSYSFYTIDEEVPAATFPGGLTRGIIPTDKRLAAYGSSTSAGVTAGSGIFYDQQMGMTCWSGSAGDGMSRCLPNNLATPDVYKDPLCAEPLAPFMPCGPRLVLITDTDVCPARQHIFPYKEMYKGPVWRLSGANCAADGTGTYFTLGDEIPPANFELLVTTTDP